MTETVPVTVVSGSLGAGKTTLMNHVLTNREGYEVAVIVNDMGEVNVDADLIRREGTDEEGIVDLSNGCICCELRDDLLAEARRLAESREFDYLLVESSGISEPIPVARTFTEGGEDDPPEGFHLDTTVSVIDAAEFERAFDAGEVPDEGSSTDLDRPLTELLIDQIEFCDLLLLNKTDLVEREKLEEIEAVIERLQPRAEIVRTTYSEISPERVLGTGRSISRRPSATSAGSANSRGPTTITTPPNRSASSRSSTDVGNRSIPNDSTKRSSRSQGSFGRRGSSGSPGATTSWGSTSRANPSRPDRSASGTRMTNAGANSSSSARRSTRTESERHSTERS